MEDASNSTDHGMAGVIPPQCPLPELHQPWIEKCHSQPVISVIPYNRPFEIQVRQVEVMRVRDPTRSYMALQPRTSTRSTPPTNKARVRSSSWKDEFLGIILHRVKEEQGEGDRGVFATPPPELMDIVVIQRIRKDILHPTLKQGGLGDDNPYREILRMQTIGDNIHVLRCIDALEDDHFLYMIMPYCEYDLTKVIGWGERYTSSTPTPASTPAGGGGIPEERAKVIFLQLLENLVYLQRHGICHRNLTPEHCKIYQGRVVFTGLGRSFRIPYNGGLVTHVGVSGTPAYMPPEAFLRFLPFDARIHDLWSLAVILFNLLTGGVLYQYPIPEDRLFRYFVQARGISATPNNELTQEVLRDLKEEEEDGTTKKNGGNGLRRSSLVVELSQRCKELSTESLDLLEGILRVAPHQRWTIRDVEDSMWLKGHAI